MPSRVLISYRCACQLRSHWAAPSHLEAHGEWIGQPPLRGSRREMIQDPRRDEKIIESFSGLAATASIRVTQNHEIGLPHCLSPRSFSLNIKPSSVTPRPRFCR